jgi:hypothetical protein
MLTCNSPENRGMVAMYNNNLKTGQVWFSNGQFQLELAILIPDHFWLPSCCNHLKIRLNGLVFEQSFKNHSEIEQPCNFWSSFNYSIAIKPTI